MTNKINKLTLVLISTLLLTSMAFSSTAEEIIDRVIENQKRIKNWSGLYVQTVTGDFAPNGQEEIGKITVRGQKTRKDIQRPDRRITIQTETLLTEKDIKTGAITRKDLTLNENKASSLKIKPEEALLQASFQLMAESADEAMLEGHMDNIRMVITVDKTKYVPEQMSMYLPGGTSFTMVQTYDLIDGIHVLTSSKVDLMLVVGSRSLAAKTTTTYKMIKVNQNINDDVFKL
jgi:outer membrane lipoprotein-sorting protein